MNSATPLAQQNDTDSQTLERLAKEIGEVLFEHGELSTLERKVDDRLREQVSRILNRYNDYPDQLREIEEKIMSIQDPDLGIAILQQGFLVRTEAAEGSIINQLLRLVNATDLRTSEQTLNALREAAHSDIERLSNLGCRALLQSPQITANELLDFVVNPEIRFTYRQLAVETSINRQFPNGPDALLALLQGWIALDPDEQRRHREELFELSRKFGTYATRPKEEVNAIVQQLYNALEQRSFVGRDNTPRRVIQQVLASLPEYTVSFLQTFPIEQVNFSAIFTLGTCACRSTEATLLLLRWARQLLETSKDQRSIEIIAQQLQKSRHDHELIHKNLNEITGILNEAYRTGIPTNLKDAFGRIQSQWQQNGRTISVNEQLKKMAQDFEEWPELSKDDAFALKRSFEKGGHRQIQAPQLSRAERSVLIETLRITSSTSPWKSSYGWWVKAYSHFDGSEKTEILNALGEVALGEKREVETRLFDNLRVFFEQIQRTGNITEKEYATQWLDRLQGYVPIEGIKNSGSDVSSSVTIHAQ